MTPSDLRALLDAANEPTGRQLRALSTPDTVAHLCWIALAALQWYRSDDAYIETLPSALRDAGLLDDE